MLANGFEQSSNQKLTIKDRMLYRRTTKKYI